MHAQANCFVLSVLILAIPAKSQSQSDGMLSDAQDQIKHRHYDEAFTRLWVGVNDSSQVTAKARELVRKNPEFRNAIKRQLEDAAAAIKSREDALLENTAISRARWYGIIEDSVATLLHARHDSAVYLSAKDNLVTYLLSDTVAFPSLRAAPIQEAMFLRELKALEDPNFLAHKAFVREVFNYAGRSPPPSVASQVLEAALPNLHLTGGEIREYVAPLYPAFARKALSGQTQTIALVIEPADRLLEIDLAAALTNRTNAIRLLPSNVAADSIVMVTVSRLRYDERTQPEERNTVSISQTEISIVRAALLMPRNATYMYDALTKSVEIEYAFEIKASQKGTALPSVILRDRVIQQSHSCSNFRVQNVFGGSEPVTWYANDRMQSECSGSSSASSASIDVVRQQVLNALAQGILTLPPIARAVELSR